MGHTTTSGLVYSIPTVKPERKPSHKQAVNYHRNPCHGNHRFSKSEWALPNFLTSSMTVWWGGLSQLDRLHIWSPLDRVVRWNPMEDTPSPAHGQAENWQSFASMTPLPWMFPRMSTTLLPCSGNGRCSLPGLTLYIPVLFLHTWLLWSNSQKELLSSSILSAWGHFPRGRHQIPTSSSKEELDRI